MRDIAVRLRSNRTSQAHEPALADRRQTGGPEPIRITFDFSQVDGNGESPAQQKYIKDIIERSKQWLEQALKVQPLSGNLVLPSEFECGDVKKVSLLRPPPACVVQARQTDGCLL